MQRRGFLQGILVAGVAPAFVGSSILMPVRAIALPLHFTRVTGARTLTLPDGPHVGDVLTFINDGQGDLVITGPDRIVHPDAARLKPMGFATAVYFGGSWMILGEKGLT